MEASTHNVLENVVTSRVLKPALCTCTRHSFLDMPPAHPDTTKTAMVEAQRLTQLTGQDWTVFTNDQQVHRIAMHACWEEHPMFSKCVTKLGDI